MADRQSGIIAEGEVVADFENAVADYLGMLGGVATSSGTMVLFLALKALDISHGDEVIIPLRIKIAYIAIHHKRGENAKNPKK